MAWSRRFRFRASPAIRPCHLNRSIIASIEASTILISAIGATLAPADMGPVDGAIDAMIDRFKWHGRIAGDARKRNRLLQAIYKGA